jgi:hypothetical protein
VEVRISGPKDKIDIKKKKQKNSQTKDSRAVKGICNNSATPSKDQLANHSHRRRRRDASQRYM